MPSETGHAVNVANFEKMMAFVAGYGASYTPSNTAISKLHLTAKHTSSAASMDDVAAKVALSSTAINGRENLFLPIDSTVAKSVSYFESTGAPDNSIADAKGFKRKMDGVRATPVPKSDPGTPPAEVKVVHSSAQTSFTQKIEHLDGLIELYSNEPLYDPAEANLTVAGLNSYSDDLKAANTAVINAAAPLSNSRIARDVELYDKVTGMVTLANLVKKYVKAVFGPSSPEYKQLTALRFTNPR